MIEEYRATWRMEKSLLATTVKIATINRDLAVLKHLFNFAIRDGCLKKNPVGKVKFENEDTARDRALSPEECEQLQSHSALHLQAINLMAY
jgi:site-specific recombinase XerD